MLRPVWPSRAAAAVALAVGLLLTPGLAIPAGAQAGVAPAARPYRVLLDAGHGGRDPGAISPLSGLQEKDVALRVAQLTGAALQRRGVGVVYTRTDDRDVPLRERAALAARTGASVLVSVHLNAAPSPAVSGAEAWYGNGARDPQLAAAILAGLAPTLREYNVPLRGTRAGPSLAVLGGTVPSTLVELGYVSNVREASLLGQPGYLSRLAEGLASGVIAFRDSQASSTVVTGAGAAPAWRGSRGEDVGPDHASVPGAAGLANLYFIRPGDTLQTVATRFKMAVDELARLNPLAIPQRLLPGTPLQVESGGSLVAGWSATGTEGKRRARPDARGTTYTVAWGDTLSGIALATGVSVPELIRLNGLSDAGLIRAGQTLRLGGADGGRSGSPPVATSPTANGRRYPANASGTPAGAARRYLVRPGDTLSELALRFSVDQEDLMRANALNDPRRLLAGATLMIPAQS